MTFQDLTNIARDILFGESTDAELAEFHFWSEWDGAEVAFTTPSGNERIGTVRELDPDGDDGAVWLYVEYTTDAEDGRPLEMGTWLTTADCTYIGKQNGAFAPSH